MPVRPEENSKYENFVVEQIKALGAVQYDPETTLWHYTNGRGLIGIVESGSIFATHVACLNDSTEIRYAAKLMRDALLDLKQKLAEDIEAIRFIDKVLELTSEDPKIPNHAPSRFFVSCFTTQEDDLSQWRAYGDTGGENGYAIGFVARGFNGYPNSAVLRVNYDRELHKEIASKVADATLRFYREGLKVRPETEAESWRAEFLERWNEWVARLAPIVKDDCFKAENEFRIVHELNISEYHHIRLAQKETLLSRYLPLTFSIWTHTRTPTLPIAKVTIGPARHQAISLISTGVLLKQMGYGHVPITISQRPLQRT
jgi:hypothetical protein